MGGVGNGVNHVAGCGQTDPTRTNLVFTAAEPDSLTIFPRQNFGHLGVDPWRLFRRQFYFLYMILLEKLARVDRPVHLMFGRKKKGKVGVGVVRSASDLRHGAVRVVGRLAESG